LKGLDITVRDLIKVYRLGKVEIQALRGLSMMVKGGEIISIIGPSGSGKTTLLNIIGGLDTATAGIVRVGNIEVTALTISQLIEYRRKTVGHVFQTLNLIPTLTAAENVELPMIAMGVPRGKRKERVKTLLEVVGLTKRANHKPDELSGGEQQRVAIAAALANDAPVLLADEPTGELDTANAKIVVDHLVRISRELGKTIVMVTHDPSVARAADRILRIEDGVIKAALTPTQILEPSTAVSYVDQLRTRIADIDAELRKLDEDFRSGKITGDEYTERRQKLKQTRAGLEDELHMIAMGVPRGKRKERVKSLLEVVGLTERANHKPDELSGGEQQRVAIAAALANDAPILLADEPTGELDTANAKIVVDHLVRISRELGKTIVMVTHDPSVARAADRILRIEDGVIKAALTPTQIVEPSTAVSYADQLRSRIADIDAELRRLDEDFRSGKITGDEYTERRQRLKQTRAGLEDELHRMGIVT